MADLQPSQLSGGLVETALPAQLTTHNSQLTSVSDANHAGRAAGGEFGGVTNNTFIVAGRAYPLSVLPKGEQLRVKRLAGCDVRTAKEKRLDHACEMKLERIRIREADGEIDRTMADRLRRETSEGER